jgi:hypothetical protein
MTAKGLAKSGICWPNLWLLGIGQTALREGKNIRCSAFLARVTKDRLIHVSKSLTDNGAVTVNKSAMEQR